MKAEELREIRKIAREFNRLIGALRPIDSFRNPSKQAALPAPEPPEIPQDYSYVRCEKCGLPAVLVRDNTHHCFAGACLRCYTISHLETIVEEKS